MDEKKYKIVLTEQQAMQLGLICDAGLKQYGMQVVEACNQIREQMKHQKAEEK